MEKGYDDRLSDCTHSSPENFILDMEMICDLKSGLWTPYSLSWAVFLSLIDHYLRETVATSYLINA